MKKRIANADYTWAPGAAGAGTVTFTNYGTIELDAILHVQNALDGIVIYSPFDITRLGTVATNVLTLAFATATMNANDPLIIFYDDALTGEHRDAIVVKEFMSTDGETDTSMIGAIAAGTRGHVVAISAKVHADTTVNVDCRIGWGAANVPTEPATGATGVAGMVLSYPGIPPGGGEDVIYDPPNAGALGEELRITCDAPTTGKLTVMVAYFLTTD